MDVCRVEFPHKDFDFTSYPSQKLTVNNTKKETNLERWEVHPSQRGRSRTTNRINLSTTQSCLCKIRHHQENAKRFAPRGCCYLALQSTVPVRVVCKARPPARMTDKTGKRARIAEAEGHNKVARSLRVRVLGGAIMQPRDNKLQFFHTVQRHILI